MTESIRNPVLQVVVFVAKLCNADACFLDLVSGHRDDDSEIVADLETLSWQTEDTLLPYQLLQKVHFVVELWEVVDVNPDHQVHGTLWHNWTDSGNILQNLKCNFRVVLKHKVITQLIDYELL